MTQPRGIDTRCPSCRARWRVRAPLSGKVPVALRMHPATFRALRMFAAEYTQEAGAAGIPIDLTEFLDWLEVSIVGSPRYIAAHEASMAPQREVGAAVSPSTGFAMPDTATKP